nr:hypothetical protein [uncultured Duganella sp.]
MQNKGLWRFFLRKFKRKSALQAYYSGYDLHKIYTRSTQLDNYGELYAFTESVRLDYPLGLLWRVFEVSRSGFYAALERQPSQRALDHGFGHAPARWWAARWSEVVSRFGREWTLNLVNGDVSHASLL